MGSVKIPPYNPSDPSLWFSMCESAFALAIPRPITDNKTKFNYIVSHLPPEAANLARDVIIKPGRTDPYEELKTTLIKRTYDSSALELQDLLSGEELGEGKPTELLNSMKRRVESLVVPEFLMLEVFIHRMPSHVRSILSLFESSTLDKTAELADRILEAAPAVTNTVSISDTERILFEIEKLNERLDQLTQHRDELSALRTDELPRNSRFFHNSGSEEEESESHWGTRQVRVHRKFGLCVYHTRFGSKARNCKAPCKLSKREKFQR